MKIAVVCPYSIDVPGGVQEQAIGLVKRIGASGHEAWLVAPGLTGLPEAKLVGRTVNVRSNGSIAPIALHPATIARVRWAIADADVVHVHEPFVAPTSLASFLGEGPPAVGTFHADPSSAMRGFYRLAGPALKWVTAKLAAVTAVSQAARSAIDSLVDGVITIPNAIDSDAYAIDVDRRPDRVVFLGRDEPRKGLDVLLAAWPKVRAAIPGAELVVLGADRDRSQEGVRYLGLSIGPAKRQQLAEATVFCAPNLGGESFGISLVEAMAAGCAPVVSDLPAFRSVAGETARYVPVGDSGMLADRIIESLRDQDGTRNCSRAAVRMAARYDWEQVLPGYIDIYERLAR
jgi:phosphatidylinositol alpha-mannosyltransferase